jgi:glycogen debranching enzyme
MAGKLELIDGSTYFISDPSGDIGVKAAEGFFHLDMRHLSTWKLLIEGEPIEVLSSRRLDFRTAHIVGTASAHPGTNPPITIERHRVVDDGVYELLTVTNHSSRELRLVLELCFGSDFADIFDCKADVKKKGKIEVETDARTATLTYERDDYWRRTAIDFGAACSVGRERATFELRFSPRARWETRVEVTPLVQERWQPKTASPADPSPETERSSSRAPVLETSHASLSRSYRQSLEDLAALCFRPLDSHKGPVLAGGLPWFMALFGRDSLLGAYESLPFWPELARGTLEALARLQATARDDFRDAQPGKILHELRFGELATVGDVPHQPYYGSHGATPLFLIVLDEYERWTGDRDLAVALEPAARAALAWLESDADLDDDGYIEYLCRSPKGLENQGWKDARDAIAYTDGTLAAGPIATCELQGYAYDARCRVARLAREVWGDVDLANRLEREATDLRRRFNEDFWIEERGHFALALDGDKRPVDSLTSNTGQLLWSGVVSEDRAGAVVARLLEPSMLTRFGIRTMSANEVAFNPLGYHTGSIWPHDNALIVEGMRRYGFRREAARVAMSVLEIASSFDHTMPELIAGVSDDAGPVGYPHASSPQAWAAGSVLLLIRSLLGLDALDGQILADPHVPDAVRPLALRELSFRGRRVDVEPEVELDQPLSTITS